ncbi:hypothetical protein GGR58DRAFT_527846 [Xylaria digitata]|nr:hypothetical protein GGR58DRAFT_527846 [Xylaria digitata]
MADPLSIASGALAAITAAVQTTSIIYKFIRDCKEARGDLTQITRELSELTLILELIKDESAAATKDCLPNALQIQVQAMLTSCTTSVQQIEKILAKCRGKPGPLRWTVLEKDKVTALKSSLEAFKSGLSLALETLNLSMTREIKNATEIIQDSTAEIKRDTTEILDEIYKLRNQLPTSAPSDQERLRLEQWLDNLTHYAETIVTGDEVDDEVDEDSDAASFLEEVEKQNQSDDDATTQPSVSITSHTGAADTGNDGIPVHHGGEPLSSEEDLIDLDSYQPTLPRRLPPETDNSATKEPNLPRPSKRGQNKIPYHIIDSKPCSSTIVRTDYCMALDIWATLHKDRILRLWSPLEGEALMSLPVLQEGPDDPSADAVNPSFDNTDVIFCPMKPEFILIYVKDHKIEVWDWKKKVEIKIAPDARKMFIKDSKSWVRFVPRSTLIYAHDHKKYLIIVDLIAPLRFGKISISDLTRQTRFRDMWFVSYSEILIIQKISTASFKRAWTGRLFRLPSPSNNPSCEDVSINTRYSPEIIGRACVTAEYDLPRELKSESEIIFDNETRRLTVISSYDLHRFGFKRGIETKLSVVNIDKGVRLSQWHYPCAIDSLFWPPGSAFIVSDTKRFKDSEVVRVEDGHSLGTIPRSWSGFGMGSNGIVLLRCAGSNIEFAMTDVRLGELAGVPMK